MKTFKIVLLLVMAPTFYVTAQSPSKKIDGLKHLEWMVGKWAGSGWSQMGPGERYTFNQTEHIYKKLGDQLIVIDGEGRDTETDEVTFQAFGVIKAKSDSTFQFSAYTKEGRHALASAKLEGEKLIWWFDAGNGATVRYEIKLSEDSWVEDGYYIPSPESKYHMFHMKLKKQ